MEQLGFELSPVVKDASIQKNRLRDDLEVMERVIDQYNGMIEKMGKPDVWNNLNTLFSLTNKQQIRREIISSS